MTLRFEELFEQGEEMGLVGRVAESLQCLFLGFAELRLGFGGGDLKKQQVTEVAGKVVGDAEAVPPAVADMQAVLARHGCPPAGSLERFAFYERAAGAFAVVATGETRVYGNVILRKGVVLQGGNE